MKKNDIVERLHAGDTVSWGEFKENFTLVEDPQNRKVTKNHAAKLAENISKTGNTIVRDSEIVPAVDIINQGEKNYYNGEFLTMETPGVKDMYVIVDGNHRNAKYNHLSHKFPGQKNTAFCKVAPIPDHVVDLKSRDAAKVTEAITIVTNQFFLDNKDKQVD